MATKKVAIKKSVKKVKPAFTVDMTDVESISEAYNEITAAKMSAGLNIRPEQHMNMMLKMVKVFNKMFYMLPKDHTTVYDGLKNKIVEKVEKKPNVFKRFWNWITRKK